MNEYFFPLYMSNHSWVGFCLTDWLPVCIWRILELIFFNTGLIFPLLCLCISNKLLFFCCPCDTHHPPQLSVKILFCKLPLSPQIFHLFSGQEWMMMMIIIIIIITWGCIGVLFMFLILCLALVYYYFGFAYASKLSWWGCNGKKELCF